MASHIYFILSFFYIDLSMFNSTNICPYNSTFYIGQQTPKKNNGEIW